MHLQAISMCQSESRAVSLKARYYACYTDAHYARIARLQASDVSGVPEMASTFLLSVFSWHMHILTSHECMSGPSNACLTSAMDVCPHKCMSDPNNTCLSQIKVGGLKASLPSV